MKQRNTKLSNEEFLERMKNINPNISFLSKYNTRKTRINCVCNICGNKWSPFADKLLEGRGCPKCAVKLRPQCMAESSSKFENDFNKTGNKNVLILDKYKNANTKLHCKCKVCGYEWFALPSVLLYGHGCKECGYKKASLIERKNSNKFLKEFNKTGNKNVELLESYTNCHTKIKCKCKKCGHIYYASPNHLLQGQGCRICYQNNSKKENHPRWDKNKTDHERIIKRKYKEYSNFVESCLKRDNYTCQITQQVGGKLNVHHLNGYSWCKNGRLDINNGITLSEKIHKEFHSTYGIINNTKKQFVDFIHKLYKEKRITNYGYDLLLKRLNE